MLVAVCGAAPPSYTAREPEKGCSALLDALVQRCCFWCPINTGKAARHRIGALVDWFSSAVSGASPIPYAHTPSHHTASYIMHGKPTPSMAHPLPC